MTWTCLAALAASVALAAPEYEETDDAVIVRNQHFEATFSRANGGLLSRLVRPDGGEILAGSRLYTDTGYFQAKRHPAVSSSNCTEPRLTVKHDGPIIEIEAAGRLVGSEAGPWDRGLAAMYSATYRVDDSPRLWCECVCWAEFDDPEERSAFLALVFHPSQPMTEVFALTADGLICRGVTDRSQRIFQSSQELLDPVHPFFGCLNSETGDFLAFAAPGPEDWSGLDHAIIHDSGNGHLAPFLCFRDGYHPQAIQAGKRHTLEYTIEAGTGDLRDIAQRLRGHAAE